MDVAERTGSRLQVPHVERGDGTPNRVIAASGSPIPLPRLECLRFFDAAARHQSFVRAASEMHVTPAAVAYRVKMLESHLGHSLFDRTGRGITLNSRGKACFGDVRHILTEIGELVERHRSGPKMRRLTVVAVESVADRWLMPRLVDFNASRPDIAIDLETDLLVDHHSHDYDVWITYAGEARAPGAETAHRETLFEETMFPVCSPALLAVRGQPHSTVELRSWPLIHHRRWPADWSRWFAAQGDTPPDTSNQSSFRLFSMLIRAAVGGMGAAIGRTTLIASELDRGTLVPLLDRPVEMCATCLLITTTAASRKPHVREFRDWILRATADECPRGQDSR